MPDANSSSDKQHQLELAVNELTVLNDIATTISSTQPIETIINQIVTKCIKHLQVEEGTVSLLNEKSELSRFQTMVRRQDSSAGRFPIKLDDRLTGWMLKNRTILLSNDIRNDNRFNFLDDQSYSFRSIICVPLMIKGELIGYLAVFNKKNGTLFTDEDRRLLSIIGSQSAQVIENARLYEEEKALITLQEEFRLAHEIQLKLLPDHSPKIAGYQIAATNIPAKSVGGDYYDFIEFDSDRLAFCIGDITGKGIAAALLMANLQATIRSQAIISEDSCLCMQRTNKLLFRNTESTKFATLFYGLLDVPNNCLTYVNGGHDAPLLFKKGMPPYSLESTGLLLGVMEETEYAEGAASLEADDLLVLYTDGITEAMNEKQEEFGREKLVKLIDKNRDEAAEKIIKIILQEVRKHANKTPQSDDITLMVIKKC